MDSLKKIKKMAGKDKPLFLKSQEKSGENMGEIGI